MRFPSLVKISEIISLQGGKVYLFRSMISEVSVCGLMRERIMVESLKTNHRLWARMIARSHPSKAPPCKNANLLERRQSDLKKLPKAPPAQKQPPCVMFSKIQPLKHKEFPLTMTEREPISRWQQNSAVFTLWCRLPKLASVSSSHRLMLKIADTCRAQVCSADLAPRSHCMKLRRWHLSSKGNSKTLEIPKAEQNCKCKNGGA